MKKRILSLCLISILVFLLFACSQKVLSASETNSGDDYSDVYLDNGGPNQELRYVRMDLYVKNMDNAIINEENEYPFPKIQKDGENVEPEVGGYPNSQLETFICTLNLESDFWLFVFPVVTPAYTYFSKTPVLEIIGNNFVIEPKLYKEGDISRDWYYALHFEEAGEYTVRITFGELERTATFIVN